MVPLTNTRSPTSRDSIPPLSPVRPWLAPQDVASVVITVMVDPSRCLTVKLGALTDSTVPATTVGWTAASEALCSAVVVVVSGGAVVVGAAVVVVAGAVVVVVGSDSWSLQNAPDRQRTRLNSRH